ncbi:MAG: DUF3035 domain-containing protein [Pseudomonadota bacterium]
MTGRLTLAMICALALSGCGSQTPSLFNIRKADRTPDEFSILPSRPLEQPADLSALPPPTRGLPNRTDRQPIAEAVAALGGNVNASTSADAALLASAGRFGVQPTIREQLATEDLDFRRRNNGRLLERAFNVTVYYRAYRRQSLDQYAELERLRQRGIRTVAAPPRPSSGPF